MNSSARRWGALVAFGLLATLPIVANAAEPCNLLTVQEIAQALGNPVSHMPLGTTGCMWKGSPQGVSIMLRDASAATFVRGVARQTSSQAPLGPHLPYLIGCKINAPFLNRLSIYRST